MGLRDILSLIGSMILLAGVLALAYYASRWYAKRMSSAYGHGKYIRVIDRTSLSQGSAVCVVKAGEKYYLLGIGDKSVSMLTELDGFEEQPEQPGAELPFQQLFGNVMDKIKKPENRDNGEGR